MIDLHGVKHEDVTDIMIDACSKRDTPFVVITGNSSIMKRIVSFAVAKFGLEAKEMLGNPGRLIIQEK
jgi:hypothetical protein